MYIFSCKYTIYLYSITLYLSYVSINNVCMLYAADDAGSG